MEAVERLARHVTGEWFERDPYTRRPQTEEGSLAPYHPANRPMVREQLNTSRRLHPEWPAEWYVRVPHSRVTWDARDLAVWGIEGRRALAVFPDAEQAEAFAQKTWREVWHVKDTAAVQVNRQRVFVFDRERPGDLEALRQWEPIKREGLMNDAIFVMRHVDVAPGAGRFDLDVEGETRRRQWLETFAGVSGRAGRSDAVYFNPEAFDRSGYRTFVEAARRAWTQAGAVGAADPEQQQTCRDLRTALASAVQILNGDIQAAMGHEAPRPPRTSSAPLLAEYGEFEAWYASQRSAGPEAGHAAPVERSPVDFQRALDKAREHALALRPTAKTAADLNSMRLEMDRLYDQALAFRSREVGIYAAGHINEVVVQSILEGQGGLATDNRVAALDDNALVAATKLPSGKFIVWRARTDGLDDELHPMSVGKRLFDSLDEVKASVDGAAVTLKSSGEAIELWRKAVRDPRLIREAMTPVAEMTAGRTVSPEEPSQVLPTRWAIRLAPLGPGRSILFAEDTWSLEDKPVLVREDPVTQALVPLRAEDKGTPAVVTGGTFAERVMEAQARWPEASVQPADLPATVARAVVTRFSMRAEPVGPKDALWHVSPAGISTPAVAVAWTYQVTTTEGVTGLRAVALARGDRSLVRFTGATAHDAVVAGYETLNSRGIAADATRRMPRMILETAQRESIRLQVQAEERAALRPSDPFEVFGRLNKLERGRAMKAVPEGARNVVEAASLGLQPRELAPARGVAVEEVSAQYRVAERALADHFAERPELTEHKPAPRVAGPRLTV